MRRIFAIIITVVFFIWILPLGVFIKPSQEKFACAGQRAICLCSHLMKVAQKNTGSFLFKANSDSQKEEGGPSGSSHLFLAALSQPLKIFSHYRYSFEDSSSYTCQFFQSIEHVPKTQISLG